MRRESNTKEPSVAVVSNSDSMDGVSLAPHDSGVTSQKNANTPEDFEEAGRLDAQLVQRVLDGDNGAFESLVERYKSLVKAVVSRVLRDRDSVDDIVQDVFLKSYISLTTLDNPARFRSWLLQIAANRARDQVRYQSRRLKVIDDSTLCRAVDSGLVPSPHQSGESPAASKQAEQNELRERIVKAIHGLPAGYHKLAAMRYLEGCSYTEIANVLRLPEKTILRRARRARVMLRRMLQQDNPGEE